MKKNQDTILILGGAGLVGSQVAREIARELEPAQIVIASLHQWEVDSAIESLKMEFPQVKFEGTWGDIFLRKSLCKKSRKEVLENIESSRMLFQDVFWDKLAAYKESYLVSIIQKYRPDIIVDSVNTATGISYQDIYTTSLEVDTILDRMGTEKNTEERIEAVTLKKLENLLISQSIPQLIRHVQLLYDVMIEANTRIYLKIGTTGTGGMGLNIPYTHSEDKPSSKLMTKTAVAFAHTGLLFLMARTPSGPIVKEIKPGALIGYRKVDYRIVKSQGNPQYVYKSRLEKLAKQLNIAFQTDYEPKVELMMAGVDTGENGFFTLGEFEAITSLGQMEFITPEEIAQNVVLEIKGSNTGKDVIAAIDGAIMDPSYRAGYLRSPVIEELRILEKKTNSHSVALGQLGPPELSKLLYEAHLLKINYGIIKNVLEHDPKEISERLFNYIKNNDEVRDLITSIGLPILCPDGQQIFRGPKINIPEYQGIYEIEIEPAKIDQWAGKGWVDLRPENFKYWQKRFEKMLYSSSAFCKDGSAAITLKSYLFHEIRIGEVVGWIFNNDDQISGYRIKAL
ncbi:hypothetical protein JW964_19850 [candidate division KSB1 bacterium]|nr:hypothetical protein [candidate division KSB1 bacterium]